jgi:hypothetical protein
MKMPCRFSCAALALVAASLTASPLPPRIVPGLQADGSTLLHNQWSIRPAGRQVELGDFPTSLAVHPGGRWAAVLQQLIQASWRPWAAKAR